MIDPHPDFETGRGGQTIQKANVDLGELSPPPVWPEKDAPERAGDPAKRAALVYCYHHYCYYYRYNCHYD